MTKRSHSCRFTIGTDLRWNATHSGRLGRIGCMTTITVIDDSLLFRTWKPLARGTLALQGQPRLDTRLAKTRNFGPARHWTHVCARVQVLESSYRLTDPDRTGVRARALHRAREFPYRVRNQKEPLRRVIWSRKRENFKFSRYFRNATGVLKRCRGTIRWTAWNSANKPSR